MYVIVRKSEHYVYSVVKTVSLLSYQNSNHIGYVAG